MMKDLTVILPGIHPEHWPLFCDTLEVAATNRKFELIIIGPVSPTPEVLSRDYVRFIESKACPTRCVQEATTLATGEYLSVACEGVFTPEGYDRMFDMLDQHGKEHKTVITGKYIEGASTTNKTTETVVSQFIESHMTKQNVDNDYGSGIPNKR